jgi:hypothetical protein
MSGSGELHAWIDCRGRNAHGVMAAVLPCCLDAGSMGLRPTILVDNLDLLGDSITRLLKALDRMADALHARVVVSDASGYATAFMDALSIRSHFDRPT